MNERIIIDMLTKEQNTLATTDEQNILCLASAGSGKTYTLTNRVEHLIKEKGVDPASIIIFSFSRTATQEMRERLKELLGNHIYGLLTITTFHAYCFHIIKRYEKLLKLTNFEIVSMNYFLASLDSSARYKETQISNRTGTRPEITISKEAKEDCQNQYSDYRWKKKAPKGKYIVGEIKEVFKDTVDYFKRSKILLFNDLLILVKDLFKSYPEILANYQDQFKYVILDEAQDTQETVFDVLDQLISPSHHHFMAVGDIQQTLYGFNGADPERLVSFSKKIESKIFNLSETFRFGQTVSSLADRVVDQMTLPEEYKIHTTTNQTSDDVVYLDLQRERIEPEAQYFEDVIYNQIMDLRTQGIAWKDMFVLGRMNKPLTMQAQYCQKKKLPVIVKAGSMLNRKEIKFCLSMIDTIYNFSVKPFTTFASEYNYGVDAKLIGKALENFEGNTFEDLEAYLGTYTIKGIGSQRLEGFDRLFKKLHKAKEDLEQFKLISNAFKVVGGEAFNWMINEGDNDGESERMDFIKLLDDIFTESTCEFKDFSSLLQLNFATDTDKDEDAVTFLTIHGAKGRSLPYVIFDTSSTFKFSKEAHEIEWEKYCLYVGITRTKNKLIYCYKEGHASSTITPPQICSETNEEVPRPTLNEYFKKEEGSNSISGYGTDNVYSKNSISEGGKQGDSNSSSSSINIAQNLLERKIITSTTNIRGMVKLPTPTELIKITEKAICMKYSKKGVWAPKSVLKYNDGSIYAQQWYYKQKSSEI